MKNNKGFSLIELIIVIAIMAILVAVIAPNLTKYLGKSKVETDKKNIDEVRHQVYNCISQATINEEKVMSNESIGKASYLVSYSSSTGLSVVYASTNGTADFANLLTKSIEQGNVSSKVDKTKDKLDIEIAGSGSGGYTVKVKYTS